MSWERTGETLPDGRPKWMCKKCGKKIWGHVVGTHSCDGTKAVQPTTTILPCRFRGEVYGRMRKSSDCDCWSVVWKCGCEHIESGLCVLAPVDGDAYGKKPGICVKCEHRQETVPGGISPV